MKINEDQLRELVKNTIRESLTELSPDLAYRAADAAMTRKQPQRAFDFQTYADKANSEEHGGLQATNKRITYPGQPEGLFVTLYCDGSFAQSNGSADKNIFDFGYPPVQARVNDRRIARMIAKWCSKYLRVEESKFKNNEPDDVEKIRARFADWHSWANL